MSTAPPAADSRAAIARLSSSTMSKLPMMSSAGGRPWRSPYKRGDVGVGPVGNLADVRLDGVLLGELPARRRLPAEVVGAELQRSADEAAMPRSRRRRGNGCEHPPCRAPQVEAAAVDIEVDPSRCAALGSEDSHRHPSSGGAEGRAGASPRRRARYQRRAAPAPRSAARTAGIWVARCIW